MMKGKTRRGNVIPAGFSTAQDYDQNLGDLLVRWCMRKGCHPGATTRLMPCTFIELRTVTVPLDRS